MSLPQLEIATFPLQGARLIEASAGTGKTYTIAGLYLRLLMDRDLPVTNILVVTFTEAATQELRGRIRDRIVHALDWLEGRRATDELSNILLPLKGNEQKLQSLRDAITSMDESRCLPFMAFANGH